jgi:midasin
LFEVICKTLDKLENQEIGFVWLDGILIQAMENGTWLLLEDVNFSKPSNLDRIHSLLEPNGSILVNESGDITRLVICHPKFHLFFTLCLNVGLIK